MTSFGHPSHLLKFASLTCVLSVGVAYDQLEYRATAGTITFTMTNNADVEHELAFLPGQTCNATYELAAGTYTLFCIVETDDGQTHYDQGMKAALVVT